MSRVIRPRNERSKWNKGKASSYTVHGSDRPVVDTSLSLSLFPCAKIFTNRWWYSCSIQQRSRNSFEEVWSSTMTDTSDTIPFRGEHKLSRVFFPLSPTGSSFIGLYQRADLGFLDQLIQSTSRLNVKSTPSIANNYPARPFSELSVNAKLYYAN